MYMYGMYVCVCMYKTHLVLDEFSFVSFFSSSGLEFVLPNYSLLILVLEVLLCIFNLSFTVR